MRIHEARGAAAACPRPAARRIPTAQNALRGPADQRDARPRDRIRTSAASRGGGSKRPEPIPHAPGHQLGLPIPREARCVTGYGGLHGDQVPHTMRTPLVRLNVSLVQKFAGSRYQAW